MKLDRTRLRALAEILTSTTGLMPIREQIESAPDVGLLALLCQRLSLVKSLDEYAIGDLSELDRRVRDLAGEVHDCSEKARPTRFRRLRAEIGGSDPLLTDLADLLATTSGHGVSRSDLVNEVRSDTISRALQDLQVSQATQATAKPEENLSSARVLADGPSMVKTMSANSRPAEPAVAPVTSPPATSDRTQAIAAFAQLLATAECQQKRWAVGWLMAEITSIVIIGAASVFIESGLALVNTEAYVTLHAPIWLGLGSLAMLFHRLSAQHRQKENEYRTDRLSSVTNPNVKYYLESFSPSKQEEIIAMVFQDWLAERQSTRKILRKDRGPTETILATMLSALDDLAGRTGGDRGK